MRAEVLSIGNEVLSGRTLDTNFHFLARLLEDAGARMVGHQAVPDEPLAIAAALQLAFTRADLVVTTGGLGPTPDDLTVDAVADALGLAVQFDAATLAAVEARWGRLMRGPMPERNRRQALVPAGATVWTNPVGSAPGVLLAHGAAHVVLLPGVPEEMRALATQFLAPWLRAHSDQRIEYALVRTVGIAESVLEQRLSTLSADLGGAWVAYLPGQGGVDVRITLPEGLDPAARGGLAERANAAVRAQAGDYVFTSDDRTLEEVVGALLVARAARVAVAESCTGGLLGGRITQTPGSSAYFEGGVLCYSNASKVALCGVLPETLAAHGAVSEETARELAQGVRARFGVAYGVGVTGIAGPDGGTAEKPVGTVHVAAAGPSDVYHRRLSIFGNRAQVRERSVTAALELLRRLMLGLPAMSDGALFTPRSAP